MFKRSGLYILLLAVGMAAGSRQQGQQIHAFNQGEAVYAKASAPISITITTKDPLIRDADNTFLVSLHATTDVREVEFSLSRTPLAQPCRGDLHWRGALSAGHSQALRFVCPIARQSRGNIVVSLRTPNAVDGAGVRYATSAAYSLGDVVSRAVKPPYDIVPREQGKVREYRLP